MSGDAAVIAVPMLPLRRVIKDYFLVCETYFDAIRTAPPTRIQQIDVLADRGQPVEICVVRVEHVLSHGASEQCGDQERHRLHIGVGIDLAALDGNQQFTFEKIQQLTVVRFDRLRGMRIEPVCGDGRVCLHGSDAYSGMSLSMASTI